MLPHVVRWNAEAVNELYAELHGSGEQLAARLDQLARAGGLPRTLKDIGVAPADLNTLASEAEKEWTGTFNPRPFDAAAALRLYQSAY